MTRTRDRTRRVESERMSVVVAPLRRLPMVSTKCASRQTWRLAAVLAVASGTVVPAHAQSPTTGIGCAARQRERMDDSERRLNKPCASSSTTPRETAGARRRAQRAAQRCRPGPATQGRMPADCCLYGRRQRRGHRQLRGPDAARRHGRLVAGSRPAATSHRSPSPVPSAAIRGWRRMPRRPAHGQDRPSGRPGHLPPSSRIQPSM
jgi:hypothetical protein